MEERKYGDNRQEEKYGNKQDIKKVPTTRLEKILDENKPREQAGFKIGDTNSIQGGVPII